MSRAAGDRANSDATPSRGFCRHFTQTRLRGAEPNIGSSQRNSGFEPATRPGLYGLHFIAVFVGIELVERKSQTTGWVSSPDFQLLPQNTPQTLSADSRRSSRLRKGSSPGSGGILALEISQHHPVDPARPQQAFLEVFSPY